MQKMLRETSRAEDATLAAVGRSDSAAERHSDTAKHGRTAANDNVSLK